MAYLYTSTRALGSTGAHRGYVTYSTSETTNAVTITVSALGEYVSGSSGTYSASGSTTVSASLGSYFTRTGTKSSLGSVSANTYVSFGISSASQTITKGTSATTVRLTISWTWSGTTTTNYVDITIPAKSTSTTCVITYNANGGSGTMSNTTYTYSTSGTVILNTNTFTKTGYNFLGWSLSSTATSASYSDGQPWNKSNSGNYTLYAVWEKKTYKITYNANGGSGAPSTQTKTYGTSITLSSVKPTKTNYTFVGWNTAADGSGTSYASGAKYTTNATLKLYAIWQLNHNLPEITTNIICKRQKYEDNILKDFDDGEFFRVAFECKFDENGQNRQYSIYLSTDPNTPLWTVSNLDIIDTIDDKSYDFIPEIIFDKDTTFNFVIKIQDQDADNNTYVTTATTFISQSFFTMDFGSNGYTIGIGQAAEILEDKTSANARLDIGIPVYFNAGPIGNISTTSDTATIASGASYINTETGFELNPGKYILIGNVYFSSNSTGLRNIQWHIGSSTVNGAIFHSRVTASPLSSSSATQRMQTVAIVAPTSTTTYNIGFQQSSGGDLSINIDCICIRIC